MAIKRTNYVRANDGKFAHTPGGGAKKAATSKAKPKTATKAKGTTAKKPATPSLSAAKTIAADEKKLATKGGTAGGTITAKGFKKTYAVKVAKGKDGSSTRTVTRHTTKTVNGKKVNVDVTRQTTTDKSGRTTVKRTVGTGKGAKTTVTHKAAGRKVTSSRKR